MNSGRDELNLAEFPLAALSHWVPASQKTLVFEDTIRDKGHQREVTRRLTIAASDKYGLPTALDDEVIFGLVQLTKAADFAARTVPFSRYQLVQILGWQDGGKSYRRLEESLKRWLGVTLYYENAWWDKRSKRWADAHFHLLDNLVLYHRRCGKAGAGREDQKTSRSSFTWNEVVFRSFQAGYLKQIDVGLYRNLALATAKRMYRFLDKRFYFSCRLQFSLSRFAYEHIGLSRNYDVAQLKRQLDPAVAELESVGFLEPMEAADRYHRLCRGVWQVVFLKKVHAKRRKAEAGTDLVRWLSQRGVSAAAAANLVRGFSECLIREKITVFDEMVARRDTRVSRNPAGYLVQSIREDYQIPNSGIRDPGRNSPVGRQPMKHEPAKPVRRSSDRHKAMVDHNRRARVQQYLSRLSAGELLELEQAALASAPRTMADGYDRAKVTGNDRLLGDYRQAILRCHVEQLLAAAVKV